MFGEKDGRLTCNPDMLELRHQLTVEAAKSFSGQEPASLLREHVIHLCEDGSHRILARVVPLEEHVLEL